MFNGFSFFKDKFYKLTLSVFLIFPAVQNFMSLEKKYVYISVNGKFIETIITRVITEIMQVALSLE